MKHNNRETLHRNNTSGGSATGALMLSSKSMVGNKVCNRDHEDVGEIKDFMVDTKSGQLEYAVLSFGSFLGMGEKLFAVPFRALNLDTKNKSFILDVDKELLKKAPGFDKDNWPNMADQTWAQNIHSFYGAQVTPKVSPTQASR